MKFEPLHARIPALARDEARALIVAWAQGDLPADQYVLVEHFDADPAGSATSVALGVVRASTREHVATIAVELDAVDAHGIGAASRLLPDAPQSALSAPLLELFRETLGTEARYLRSLRRHGAAFRATLGALPAASSETAAVRGATPARTSAVSRAYPPRNNGRGYP
jgi:hypothetical protein